MANAVNMDTLNASLDAGGRKRRRFEVPVATNPGVTRLKPNINPEGGQGSVILNTYVNFYLGKERIDREAMAIARDPTNTSPYRVVSQGVFSVLQNELCFTSAIVHNSSTTGQPRVYNTNEVWSSFNMMGYNEKPNFVGVADVSVMTDKGQNQSRLITLAVAIGGTRSPMAGSEPIYFGDPVEWRYPQVQSVGYSGSESAPTTSMVGIPSRKFVAHLAPSIFSASGSHNLFRNIMSHHMGTFNPSTSQNPEFHHTTMIMKTAAILTRTAWSNDLPAKVIRILAKSTDLEESYLKGLYIQLVAKPNEDATVTGDPKNKADLMTLVTTALLASHQTFVNTHMARRVGMAMSFAQNGPCHIAIRGGFLP